MRKAVVSDEATGWLDPVGSGNLDFVAGVATNETRAPSP